MLNHTLKRTTLIFLTLFVGSVQFHFRSWHKATFVYYLLILGMFKIMRKLQPKRTKIQQDERHLVQTRARRKFLSLAYMELWTSGRSVGTRTRACVTATLVLSFLGRNHELNGSVLACCRRCPWSHGRRPKDFTLVWRWHQVLSKSLSKSLSNGLCSRISRWL